MPACPLDMLTLREEEILEFVAAFLTDREIGEQLTISEYTVHTHVRHILRKLLVRTRRQAAQTWHAHIEEHRRHSRQSGSSP